MIGFFLFFAAAIAALGVIYHFWSRRVEAEIAEGAEVEWARMRQYEPEFLEPLTEEEFRTAYRRAKFPRFPKYALATLAAFAVALPVVLGVLGGAVLVGERMGLIAEPIELAKYVPLTDAETAEAREHNQEVALYLAKNFGGFYYFFGLLASWLLIVAVVMRRFHKRRPGFLREEIIIAREAKLEGAK